MTEVFLPRMKVCVHEEKLYRARLYHNPKLKLQISRRKVHPILLLLLAAVTEVYMLRTNLKGDLITLFKKDHSASLGLVKIIDDRGQEEEGEGVGVLRDVIATFWQQLFASASVGNMEKVPSIRHDFQKLERQAIARILVDGFKSVSYFPVALLSAFLGVLFIWRGGHQ